MRAKRSQPRRSGGRPKPSPSPRGRGKRPAGKRSASGRWVVGAHAVREVFKVRPQAITEFWVKEGMPRNEMEAWEELANQLEIRPQKRSLQAFDSMASGHQGVAVLVTEDPEIDMEKLLAAPKACLVVLDQVEDPQNLGSILRTSWLMGVSAIGVARDHAVGLTSTVCKVASGGAEHIPLLQLGTLATDLATFKKAGFWVFGLDESGTKSLYQLGLPERIIWVLGAEGRGLRKSTKNVCDELVQIPQVSTGSSYNVAISAALCLGETHRQKGFFSPQE